MTQNNPNLSLHQRSNAVALLQSRLLTLGYTIATAEILAELFGESTQEAVQRFQQREGLLVTGAVDGVTAQAIVARWESDRTILTSRAYVPPHVISSVPAVMGEELAATSASTPPLEFVQQLHNQPGLVVADSGGNGSGLTNQPTPDKSIYVVTGTVTSPDRAGVGGLHVYIFDKNVGDKSVRPEAALIQTVTDTRGHYQVSFSAELLRKQNKLQPDLQACIFIGETFLAASAVYYNASTYEVLNVNLPANSNALPSEHETLLSSLAAHYTGRLGELQENAEQQDITYLANKTGWDARAVALAALADQFSQRAAKVEIHPAFFYALFRAGLPANEDALYRADSKSLVEVWHKAVEQGILSPALAQTIPQVAEHFQSISTQKLLTGPALAGVSSLKELLTTSRLTEVQQEQFAQLYTRHQTDLPTFWQAVEEQFGVSTVERLQLDGKLGFLTINNAPLVQGLHSLNDAHAQGLTDPLQLAQAGYYQAGAWDHLLTANIPIPKEIPGDTAEVQRANYAQYLASQVRLSYPTASVAQMIRSRELPIGASEQVYAFLNEHQGNFEIGMQPVQQYIATNKLKVADEVVTQVKRLQRVYQITPSDLAMIGLLKRGVDAAYHVVRHDKEAFVESYQQDLGGTDAATQTYEKAIQVHNTVLNIAVSYLTARNSFQLGALPLQNGNSGGQVLQPAPAPAENAGDVLAYPTLEGLFGSMDFCSCDECRSILSPAAYLVDLLLFIDQTPLEAGKENPQAVLLERRPDIQHLPLTCENTNAAIPYIDVVNETLEYFIANTVQKLSLKGYMGHDTDGTASEDALASPQFVLDTAYTTLQQERFPAPLPFHLPLESLRRYYEKFGVSLPLALERLRVSDDLERGGHPYGWRDILMETIHLSRDEYEILTDSTVVPLWRAYGFPHGTSDTDVIAALSNAKQFAIRVGVSYEDLVALLQTRFINPNSDLVPKLQRLSVPFTTLKALKDGTITDGAFDALLPTGAGTLDPAAYGGDIKAWVKNSANYARIMNLLTLTNTDGSTDMCDFSQFEFRYARPMANMSDTSTRLGAAEFVRLLRFIRLWKKLQWTIEQTDAVINALYRQDLMPPSTDDIDTVAKLDNGFLFLLPRLGVLESTLEALNLHVQKDLLPLLASWSDLATYGDQALYRQMFLNPALLAQDAVFADNGYGGFLVDGTQKLKDHAEAVRAAFNLTSDEYERIVTTLNYDANTVLNIPNISAIYRRGYQARTLRLSVREFLLLVSLSGLDPFTTPDVANPAILLLSAFVQALKARGLKPAVALYLLWNQDLSGKSAPDPIQITELARTLRGDYASIEDQFAVVEDPGGDVARARMTLVYGQEAADAFFALLDNTKVLDVPYTHTTPTLDAAITTIDSKLAYDDFRHLLIQTGLLDSTTKDALKLVAGVTLAFKQAIEQLFALSEDAKGSFFTRYPELKPLYDTYIASGDPPAQKRKALLAAFQPELSRLRKQQQALQRISAATQTDLVFAQILLNPSVATNEPYPLHAIGHSDQPALNDVLALETPGLAVQFFYRNTATGAVDLSVVASARLDYSISGENPLPANPVPGNAISGIWRGSIETPEAGFYNIIIETDAGAQVTLNLTGQAQALTQNGTLWRNVGPLELKAGKLYDIVLTVEQIKERLSVKWETQKRLREVIPARYLYPPTLLVPFTDTYTRFLKAASLAVGLYLSANELSHFATNADYQIAGDGWLNVLPVEGDPAPSTAVALLKPLLALLDFVRIKTELVATDEQLLMVLNDPVAATAHTDSLLYTLAHWDAATLTVLLTRFGASITDLAHLELFSRIYDAFVLVEQIGVAGNVLLQATTNAPVGDTVRTLQAALRARYAVADWRDVVKPINDELRGLQRDALVAYILHQLRAHPATAHIDTADKLFEYFLMDVQMEPCMQTSRIRHALSSVQLFIERGLMNLEPRVSPASINGKQWQWMKRYRLWEANRKVFLFPENWLEPELRDDKSPFFKEIESELLQSDITEESATNALLNYLSKLEEVAKLEPCGIYHTPANVEARTGEVDHIIARTAGAHRKYYYRRYEYGYWTPWEQIKLDIEDNPVLPVLWKDRLLLFWVRILTQTPVNPQTVHTSSNHTTTLAGLHLSTIQSDAKTNAQTNAKVVVSAVLCWSEYYNGKWQPVKTSDPHRPTTLGQFDPAGAGAFDRSALVLSMSEQGDALSIGISGQGGSSFLLYNTHSLPVRAEDQPAQSLYKHFFPTVWRDLTLEAERFTMLYGRRTFWFSGGASLTRNVLGDPLPFTTVETHHPLPDVWNAPFFLQDSRHVFFVTTEEGPVWIRDYYDYGVAVNPGIKQISKIPPLVIQDDPNLRVKPRPPLDDGGPIFTNPGVVDPIAVQRFVSEDVYIRQGLGTTGSVSYGNSQIGPAGALANGSLEL